MHFVNKGTLISGVSLYAVVAFTSVGDWLEASMIGHVLFEIPLLFFAGVLIGYSVYPWAERQLAEYNRGGIAGILCVTFVLAFWMIPRWLDASLSFESIALAKYTSITFLAGIPFAWSWSKLHFISRGVVKIEFLAMLVRLGWLYLISPNRLCNNYLYSDQVVLGQGMLLVSLALCVTWLVPIFFGDRKQKLVSPTKSQVGDALVMSEWECSGSSIELLGDIQMPVTSHK